MSKGILKNYTFNKAAKTVTLTDITTVRLDKLFLITDVTTNAILYNFADNSITATVATNVITLSTAAGASGNTDKLQIIYDVESSDSAAFADTTIPVSNTSLPLPTGASTAANQTTGNTSLASIDGKITAVNTGAVVVSSSALPALAATSTKQSDGSQKTQVVDGSGNVIGATSNALDINIKSGNPTTMPSTIADGADATLGAKADAKSTATDTTAVTIMSVLKQISASVQAPPSQAVTNAGTFAVQATLDAETTKVIGTIRAASGGIASGAVASGAFASGSIASGAIVDGAMVTLGAKADAKNSATDTTAITMMQVLKQISYQLQQEQPVIIDKFSHYEDTLTANTVKTVDIDTSGYTAVYEVEITNKSSSGTIFFSVGTSGASPTDPASTTGSTQVGGFLPAAITSITLPNNTVAASLRVKLLSATASQPFCVIVRGH